MIAAHAHMYIVAESECCCGSVNISVFLVGSRDILAEHVSNLNIRGGKITKLINVKDGKFKIMLHK